MESQMIDITGLSKAAVLAALYNRAKPLGMGMLHHDPTPMTEAAAEELIPGGDDHKRMFPEVNLRRPALYFDYLKGRVMKVDLSGDTFSAALYDRDNGDGAAETVIACLRAEVPVAVPA